MHSGYEGDEREGEELVEETMRRSSGVYAQNKQIKTIAASFECREGRAQGDR